MGGVLPSSEDWPNWEDGEFGDQHGSVDAEASIRARHRGFTLADLIEEIEKSPFYYCVTPINDRGRLADRSALRLMQWSALQSIEYEVEPGIVRVTRSGSGMWTVTRQGHLRIPSSVRLAVGIRPIDRLLVVADLRGVELRLFTMNRLDRALGLQQSLRKVTEHG